MGCGSRARRSMGRRRVEEVRVEAGWAMAVEVGMVVKAVAHCGVGRAAVDVAAVDLAVVDSAAAEPVVAEAAVAVKAVAAAVEAETAEVEMARRVQCSPWHVCLCPRRHRRVRTAERAR